VRLKYDRTADALYIYLVEGVKVARTEMIDGGTLVDLDDSENLIGIEVLAPARKWPLDEILDRFSVELGDALALRALWGESKVFPYAKDHELAQMA
jgi:uncharacterized protein YuzE